MNYKSYVGSFAFLAASLMFTACDDSSSSPSANIDYTNVKACDEMVKDDVSTWHFVEGRDLIVTIKGANGTDTKTYSMYNMESEVGVEMAYRAAKATCEGK